MHAERRVVRLTPADAARSRYVLVPFDVPAGTARLEVAYAFGSGATVDLGLVDPRGADFPAFPGFRGWSGGARRFAVLTEAAATPGYLPGPIPAGAWQVLLGLYELPPEGTDVKLTITCAGEPGEPPHHPPSPPSPPRDGGRNWYAGDLHSHSHHSDASGSLEDLVRFARRGRLDFLAVSDHNTVSHLPYLAACPDDLLLLPGMELTTYAGHLNVWGLDQMADFRCQTVEAILATLELAGARGWLRSPSHPAYPGLGWAFGYDLPFDCLEVLHGPSAERNRETLAVWDAMLRAGRAVIAVGGSDYHCTQDGDWLAVPTTWVRAESLTVAGVLAGIRAGRVVIGERGGPRPDLTVERGGERWEVGDSVPPGGPVRALATPGARLLTALGEVVAGEPLDLARHRYVRAELTGSWGVTGLTNPIWGSSGGQGEPGKGSTV